MKIITGIEDIRLIAITKDLDPLYLLLGKIQGKDPTHHQIETGHLPEEGTKSHSKNDQQINEKSNAQLVEKIPETHIEIEAIQTPIPHPTIEN